MKKKKRINYPLWFQGEVSPLRPKTPPAAPAPPPRTKAAMKDFSVEELSRLPKKGGNEKGGGASGKAGSKQKTATSSSPPDKAKKPADAKRTRIFDSRYGHQSLIQGFFLSVYPGKLAQVLARFFEF